MTINLAQANIFSENTYYTKIEEYEFWRYFVNIRNTKTNYLFTQGECDVIAAILTEDPYKSCFKKYSPEAHNIKKRLDMTPQHFYRIKNQLLDKGVLIKEGQGDYLLHPSFRNVQKAVKLAILKNKQLDLKLAFEIDGNTE